ncbi:MAG: type II toxin-antitoxin system HicB family antitoxin [Chloroflexi bacterium]|nr:type II toxin-antitoxin system HicB family antitoxin [Chloroflexota bacterium]
MWGRPGLLGRFDVCRQSSGYRPGLRGRLGRLAVRRYTVVLEWDAEAQGYAVTVPTLPGCTSQAETVEEGIANAKEAIALYLEGLQEQGQPIPEEPERPVFVVLSVAA